LLRHRHVAYKLFAVGRFTHINFNRLPGFLTGKAFRPILADARVIAVQNELAEAEQPMGKLIQPAELSRLATYLLSDDSGVITGSVIDYDQNVNGAYD